MTDDIARRLERLERIEAAKVATARYGRAVDAKDLAALADEVFTADAVLHVPGADYHGTEAIVAFYREAFQAGMGARRHFLTNHIAEAVGDDEVDITSYFFFVSADADSVIGWGVYRDIVVVHDGAARIRGKTIFVDAYTTLDEGWAASRAVEVS